MIYRAMIPPSVNRGEGATTEPDTDKQKDLAEGSCDLNFWKEKTLKRDQVWSKIFLFWAEIKQQVLRIKKYDYLKSLEI